MNLSLASGAISTDTAVRTGHGVLTYATAGQSAIDIYDGLSTTGLLLDNLSTGQGHVYDTPVQFATGLFVSVASTTGVAVVHTG